MTLYHHVSYLPISLFLSEEKGTERAGGNLSHETDNQDTQHANRGPTPWKYQKYKSFSQFRKPHFKGWSFWPWVPIADWPPTNWHNLIYLSWEEEWCEKQITENTDLYQEGGGMEGGRNRMNDTYGKMISRISWFCWKKVRWETWTSRTYL